jgi:hypothetical protein
LKSVLILSFTDLARDPRVNRQIRLLSSRYRVLAAGTAPPQVNAVDYFPLPNIPRSLPLKAVGALRLKLGQFERFYWSDRRVQSSLAMLADVRADVIVANDLATLPLAAALARGAKIIFDSHEYAPREHEDRFVWRYFLQDYTDYLCRKYLHAASGMLTVCQGIADEYKAKYGVDSTVLINAPPYHDLSPGPTDPDNIRMIHHGVTISSRKIELMIEAMDFLDERFHLDLMLIPSASSYFSGLERLAAKHPRVRIVPPVPMTELPRRLNQYDVGLFLLPPTNFNYQYALPNKLFEFIQARLAVAIGPSPEMARLVRQYDCGVVSEDFTPRALAGQLNALDRQRIDYFKQRSHQAAKEFCFEKNSRVLLDMIENLTGKP